jgi:hypothetical protein
MFITNKIEVPLERYEELVKNEERYNQLYEYLFDTDEESDILALIDGDKFNELVDEMCEECENCEESEEEK